MGSRCALCTFSGIVWSSYGPRDGTVGFRRSPSIRFMEYKTPIPLCACAPIEALDTSMYSFVVSKVHTPSVAKQRDLKCFREAPVASFHLTSCSFVMMALVHFQCTASSCGNSTLHTFNPAPSSSKASWHGLYKSLDLREGEKR